MPEDIPVYLLLVILALLLLLSGFFSLSETSMMAVNRYRLRHLAKQGHRGAQLTIRLLQDTDKLLGVILLGNNLLNTAAATLVAVIVTLFFAHSELALLSGSVVVTLMILIFSEITPKVIAAAYPERIALTVSYILTPLLKLFSPIIWFVNLFVQALLMALRLKPSQQVAHQLSMEELKTLVLEAGHFIQKKHQSVLVNLIDLESITVDDVMVPRNQIEAIDLEAEEAAIRNQLLTCHHTRFPLYRKHFDNVVGIVHVRKILNQLKEEEISAFMLESVMQKPYFIPSGTPLFSQLQLFQENNRRIGLVVDEYGEWLGLVTLEDILEEVIGEFTTHAPTQSGACKREADGSIIAEGGALLRDLNRRLGLQLPLDGPKTLNGLILEYFQDIPETGTGLKIEGCRMEILQTNNQGVKTVRIYPDNPILQQVSE